jgi:3-carboxy-cis,cis-muconate cycloisomerase
MGVVPMIVEAMDAEHERAAGSWQVEWKAIPSLFCSVGAAVSRVKNALSNLDVNTERMRANLDLDHGLLMTESVTMALARSVGRPEAQRLVKMASERVATQAITLRQALLQNEQIQDALSTTEIDRALDPASYLGSTDAWIDRALERYKRLQGEMR